MVAIRLNAVIGEDRKLTLQLPDDVPQGEVEVIIQLPPRSVNLTREDARAKLLAAGLLVTKIEAPENPVELTVEERMRIGTLPPESPSALDMINEDRGECAFGQQ